MPGAPFDVDAYLARRLEFETRWSAKDVMLYQLGLGFGRDPMDEAELAFVYEKKLVVMPSFATILAFGQRMITTADDLNLVKLLHAAPFPRATRHPGSRARQDRSDRDPAGPGAALPAERGL
jgi:hypothetical protein